MFSLVKKTILATGLALVILLALSAGYCWYLSGDIEKRFFGQKWEIPSTVYSDTTRLVPGRRVNRSFLYEKLKRLGYREKQSRPENKGEYRRAGTDIEIYFQDLELPNNTRPGVPAVIDMDQDLIRAIRRIDTKESLPEAELGPEVIMRFRGKEGELRRIVSLKEIPRHLADAVVAAEDIRFYTHFGVDPIGIIRALYTNIRSGAIIQGGSTLTQQLAKSYFLTPERTFRRKFKELFLAVTIELKYSKDEILEIYLNEIYLGQKGWASINGVGEAADFYFGKKVEHLTLAESAAIAGIIKAPNIFSPYAHPAECRERRDQVLRTMSQKQWINGAQLTEATNQPVNTAGFEKYNRRAPYFLDHVSRQLRDFYPEAALSSLGLSIYTTLDTGIQAAAEKALDNGLARLERNIPALRRSDPEKQLQGAVVVLQPRTGNILAMVGGREYAKSQFNRITRARRQPGSCFKPIVAASLLDVFKPSDLLSNEETGYLVDGRNWTPKNIAEIPDKAISVRDMLRLSCNRAAVDMAVRGGLDKIVEQVNRFNFSTPILPYPSIALGAFEVIPLELARAYCAFAADGLMPSPLAVKDISDENGRILVRRHLDPRAVISPARAFLVTSMLESVVKDGTAKSLGEPGLTFPLAGKTGTTSNYKDAWFIGYTPDFLALVWVGFDHGDPLHATGSGAALPIFAELVKSMPGHVSDSAFTIPPGVVQEKVCRQSGELATFQCPETYDEYFLAENRPEAKCHIHSVSGLFQRVVEGIKNLLQ